MTERQYWFAYYRPRYMTDYALPGRGRPKADTFRWFWGRTGRMRPMVRPVSNEGWIVMLAAAGLMFVSSLGAVLSAMTFAMQGLAAPVLLLAIVALVVTVGVVIGRNVDPDKTAEEYMREWSEADRQDA